MGALARRIHTAGECNQARKSDSARLRYHSEPEEIELGAIGYNEAPKTWSIDLPADFVRVEVRETAP